MWGSLKLINAGINDLPMHFYSNVYTYIAIKFIVCIYSCMCISLTFSMCSKMINQQIGYYRIF